MPSFSPSAASQDPGWSRRLEFYSRHQILLISSAVLLRSVAMLARLSVFAEAGTKGKRLTRWEWLASRTSRSYTWPTACRPSSRSLSGKICVISGASMGFRSNSWRISPGVSRAMLGQIETGKSAPTINLLGRIAEALKVSVPSLISSPGSAAQSSFRATALPF